MSADERKVFISKIETAQANFKTIEESRNKISNLCGAIECLEEENKKIKQPTEPNYQNVYDNKIKSLTEEYDETHKPKRPYFNGSVFWWILFLSFPCIAAALSRFGYLAEANDGEKIVLFCAIAVGLIPIVVLILNIISIISYKPRLNSYLKNNKARLLEIEKFKSKAEKAVERSREFYRDSCEKYKENLVNLEKIERYRSQWKDLGKLIKEKEAELIEFFDEMQMPKEYCDVQHLKLMNTYFVKYAKEIDLDEITALEVLQIAYNDFRKTDDEIEIVELAKRQINRKIAEEERKEREKRLKEEAVQRRIREREEKEREEAFWKQWEPYINQ